MPHRDGYSDGNKTTGSIEEELIWARVSQDDEAWLENMAVKVCHTDANVPSQATKEHQNNQ